ncbi:MAG: D-alanine--D-alanine ligase [Planctomycetales bacterium]
MRIGLTYDLRDDYLAMGFSEEETAEFDRRDTIDAIEGALRELGHETIRIGHARQLIAHLAAAFPLAVSRRANADRPDWFDLVFNICEGLSGLAREAQVPAILDVYGIPCTFSDPLVLTLALHKGLTKTIVRAAGVPTPDFAVVASPGDIAGVDLPFPLFAKPVAEGTGKGVTPASRVADRTALEALCRDLLVRFDQPVLVETYLPGREFTVGLLGSGAEAETLGTLEIILLENAEPGVYSYINKEECEERVECRLVRAGDDPEVAAAEAVALAAWRAIGGRDSGRIDVRSDGAGRPQFMEVNPIAGLHPQHSDLPMLATAVGMPYRELIGRIVASAVGRRRD